MPSWTTVQQKERFQSWAVARQEAVQVDSAEAAPQRGQALLAATGVYVLCIPKRRRHAEELLHRWGFKEVCFVKGIAKEDVDIQRCIRDGAVAGAYEQVLWEDLEYVPEGKVACHMGHMSILQKFLQDDRKSYALIFEDDLEDQPGCNVMKDLVDFLSKVPTDFDLLHLGFVRESRTARVAVDAEGTVFRSAEALGRHAYLVTKRTAELLLKETVPMYNHGDKMFQEVYRMHNLRAYQPCEPLFYQDRAAFDSELAHKWKPSRAFQPTPGDDCIRERDRVEMLRRQEERARKAQETLEQLEAQLAELPPEDQEVIRQLQAEGHDLRVLLAPRPVALLFVGVEGVLNTEKSQAAESGRPELLFLRRLAAVVQATGCSLVPTSPRCHEERWLLRFLAALEHAGVPRKAVVGCAAPRWDEHQGAMKESQLCEAHAKEIAFWLEHNPDVERWAAVDRLDFGNACGRVLAGHCVRTDPQQGLRPQDVEELAFRLAPPEAPD